MVLSQAVRPPASALAATSTLLAGTLFLLSLHPRRQPAVISDFVTAYRRMYKCSSPTRRTQPSDSREPHAPCSDTRILSTAIVLRHHGTQRYAFRESLAESGEVHIGVSGCIAPTFQNRCFHCLRNAFLVCSSYDLLLLSVRYLSFLSLNQ